MRQSESKRREEEATGSGRRERSQIGVILVMKVTRASNGFLVTVVMMEVMQSLSILTFILVEVMTATMVNPWHWEWATAMTVMATTATMESRWL